MSRTIPLPSTRTMSSARMSPPMLPIADVSCPSIPGRLTMRQRAVNAKLAEGCWITARPMVTGTTARQDGAAARLIRRLRSAAFGQAEDVAVRVREQRKPCHAGDLCRRHHHGAAEGNRLVEGRLEVGHLRVHRDAWLVVGLPDSAGETARRGIDEPVIAHVGHQLTNLPAEQLGVELPQSRGILADDLEMNDGATHDVLPPVPARRPCHPSRLLCPATYTRSPRRLVTSAHGAGRRIISGHDRRRSNRS